MENSPVILKDKSRWIHGLDSIRFVLAFIVMLGHMPNPSNSIKYQHNLFIKSLMNLKGVMFCGPAAVITFFILSGFVIHFPNRNKESFDIKSYLVRRVFRIGLPLLVVVLIGNYFNLFNEIPIWSLYCELFYYALYPLLFKLKLSWYKQFVITFIISYAVIFSFNFDTLLSFIHQRNINYKPEYWELGVLLTTVIGLPCWLLGVVLASKVDHINYKVRFRTLVYYRVLIYLISCLLLVATFHFHLGYIFTLNIFALIAVKWIEKEIIYYKTHDYSRILEYMGRFSYSLYLWHKIIFVWLGLLALNSLVAYPIYFLLTVAIAYILYLVIEYPSHKAAVFFSGLIKK